MFRWSGRWLPLPLERTSSTSVWLETMLEIAGGAAHEINQPLTAILGYAEMSLVQLEEDSPIYRNQKLIADAAVRITEIVKRMQTIREYRTRPYANGHRIVDFRPQDQDGEDEKPD